MSDDEQMRASNADVVRRFFTDDYGGDERRNLWAEDGVFELPFARSGRQVVTGRDAISALARTGAARLSAFKFVDVVVHPALDPELFFVSCRTEGISVETGEPVQNEMMNILRIRGGKVIHRVEYHNPLGGLVNPAIETPTDFKAGGDASTSRA